MAFASHWKKTPAAKDPEDNVQGGRRARIRHSLERGCKATLLGLINTRRNVLRPRKIPVKPVVPELRESASSICYDTASVWRQQHSQANLAEQCVHTTRAPAHPVPFESPLPQCSYHPRRYEENEEYDLYTESHSESESESRKQIYLVKPVTYLMSNEYK